MMIAPEIHKSRYLPWRQDAFKDRPYLLLETIEMPAIRGKNRHTYYNNRRRYSQSDFLHHFLLLSVLVDVRVGDRSFILA
jgi:hypothetical protein